MSKNHQKSNRETRKPKNSAAQRSTDAAAAASTKGSTVENAMKRKK